MYEKYIKRLIDIIVALVALPFFLLILIFVVPLILINDGFPIFYSANRVGKNGKIFKMIKFRSMKNNAPDIRLEDGSTFNAEDDPRVTKVGRILRKTSIDEVPQILNVLRGDMSIVGPRPFLPAKDKRGDKDFKDRLLVKPGITGYTQAYYRNSISQEEKIQYDAQYARSVSFKNDINIFLKTISTVLKREKVYQDSMK